MIKENKLSSTFNDAPHTVINKKGSNVVVENEVNGQILQTNVIHLKKVAGVWNIWMKMIQAK